MIRWLHISDLHLNDCNFSSERLRDELPSFLRNKRMKCDYVFCTGDIRSANVRPNSFTEDMADYMRNICHAVGVPIERLFIVPGNHDVNIFAEGREDAIKHIVPYDGYYKTRVRDNILKSKEQKNIQPTKGGHKMVTCQNYVSLFYRQITSCPSDGGIS